MTSPRALFAASVSLSISVVSYSVSCPRYSLIPTQLLNGGSIKLSSSEFVAEANKKFGDQHFKTAIALIELHKVRTGAYPRELREIEFYGDWDTMAMSSIRYAASKDLEAYRIEVLNGWMGKPKLQYPPEFWSGLGYDESLSMDSSSPRLNADTVVSTEHTRKDLTSKKVIVIKGEQLESLDKDTTVAELLEAISARPDENP